MAMDNDELKQDIISEMEALGFKTTGTHAKADELAQAIANAVVKHIQEKAKAIVTSGSSAGNWPIE